MLCKTRFLAGESCTTLTFGGGDVVQDGDFGCLVLYKMIETDSGFVEGSEIPRVKRAGGWVGVVSRLVGF